MVKYEFKCVEDELTVEIPATDAETPSCPICGKQMKRVYSLSGIVFKGSGFYKTDAK